MKTAVLILGTIAKDQAAGTSIDEGVLKLQRQIVVEHESFLKRKQSETLIETNRQGVFQKRNRLQNEAMGTMPKKPKRKQHSAAAARHFCDMTRDIPKVAVIDANFTSPSTIQERWVEIDVRLSSLVLSYV